MVQTYEGALTETDSILQRMKTLADQAANGTYQDDVDRDAIQLEFNQLNDELDQIADTDFNGVVVLNGGQMADGTRAVNGKFDYAKGDSVAPTQLGKSDVNVLGGDAWDDTNKAKTAWAALNSAWTRDPSNPSTSGPESVDITFQFDKSTSQWKAISASEGASIKNVTTTGTQNGGFKVQIGGQEVSNVTMNQTVINDKDTLTLTFNYPSTGISAPTNATASYMANASNFTENDLKLTSANNLTTVLGETAIAEQKAVTVAQKELQDAQDKVDEEWTKIKNAINAWTVAAGSANEATKNALLAHTSAQSLAADTTNLGTWKGAAAGASDTDFQAAVTDLGKPAAPPAAASGKYAALETAQAALTARQAALKMVTDADMKNEDINKLFDELNNATFTAEYSTSASKTGDFYLTLQNGTKLVDVDDPANAGQTKGCEFTIGQTNFKMKTDAASGLVSITSEDGQTTYMSIIASANEEATDLTADPKVNNSTGKLVWDLGINNNTYDAGAKPTVEVAKSGLVSKSNSNKYATAPLTYTDHVVLQAGARTKDSVDFTFEYVSGGLGDLKANLNCSSREDGLGTSNLNLTDQKSANYAIDRIDNAINKVSMVRATFGAVQNRLEHKIDNMNVTKENLTSAESRIRDTNMAEEMTNFTKNQILSQASQAMLAQANQLPQGVLQLLG